MWYTTNVNIFFSFAGIFKYYLSNELKLDPVTVAQEVARTGEHIASKIADLNRKKSANTKQNDKQNHDVELEEVENVEVEIVNQSNVDIDSGKKDEISEEESGQESVKSDSEQEDNENDDTDNVDSAIDYQSDEDADGEN